MTWLCLIWIQEKKFLKSLIIRATYSFVRFPVVGVFSCKRFFYYFQRFTSKDHDTHGQLYDFHVLGQTLIVQR